MVYQLLFVYETEPDNKLVVQSRNATQSIDNNVAPNVVRSTSQRLPCGPEGLWTGIKTIGVPTMRSKCHSARCWTLSPPQTTTAKIREIDHWDLRKKCFLNVFRICTNIFVDRRFVTKPHYFCSQLSKFLLISAEQRRLHEYNICTGNLSPTDLFAPWPAMRFFSKYTF